MEIIKQPQPRRVAGFVPVKQFAHKAKVRRNASRNETGKGSQDTRVSPWYYLEIATGHRGVDMGRVNWPGLIYVQQSVFDSRPRLVRAGARAGG